jgi:hypothetical protein
MKRYIISLTVLIGLSLSVQLNAQSLQVGGAGAYGIISGTGLPLGITQFTLPPVGGTLIVAPGPGDPSLAWLTAGNNLTLNVSPVLGSTSAHNVVMIANGSQRLVLLSSGGVNLVGTNELQMNGNPGTAGYILQSNGAGANPTWVVNSGAAVSGEPILTFAADGGSLTDNRVLTAGTGIDVTITAGDNNAATVSVIRGDLTSSDITVGSGTGAVVGSGTTLTINKGNLTSSDITVGSGTNAVLGSGTTLTIGTNAVTNAKFRQSAALSVVGNSTNATADVADITAGTDGHVLRRSGTSLGFGQIATAGIGDDQVTFAKIQDITDNRLLGRSAGTSGDMQEISVGSGLTLSAGTLSTTGLAPNNADYLVLTNDASLTNERAFGVNSTLSATDGGANSTYTLGINLGNANTWTADQLLPATDAQGTNLIAAVNASTTGTINEPRIASSIARDNESPAAGDVSGSLFAGYAVNAVQTAAGSSIVAAINSQAALINGDNINIDATLTVASNKLGINLSNANTWTHTQTFPATDVQGNALTASVNAGTTTYLSEGRIDASTGIEGEVLTINGGVASWQPSAQSLVYGVTVGAGSPYDFDEDDLDLLAGNENITLFDLSSTANINITGIVAGANGRSIILYNSGTFNIELLSLNGGSAAANQFDFPGGDVTMTPGSIVSIVYVGGNWRLISAN